MRKKSESDQWMMTAGFVMGFMLLFVVFANLTSKPTVTFTTPDNDKISFRVSAVLME